MSPTSPTATTRSSATTTFGRHIPALTWIPRYDRAWLGKDIVGGLAAGSVVVPQAMAYASIADLPAQTGLYTCMVPMVVYALLGGSRTLSVSTTSTVAVLTGSTLLAANLAADADDPARALASLTVLVGVILIVARLLKLGALVDNISPATLTGIKIGVGLTVAAKQVPALLGITGDPTADDFVAEIRGIIDDLDSIEWTTVALSAITLAILIGVARIAPKVPGPLVAVGFGIAAIAILRLDEDGVALIAPVPSGLPTPVLPILGAVDELIAGALAIAVMCFLETASVAGSVRRPTEPSIDNDQELLANGVACVAGGFFRSMPSAGGFSQTAINQNAGAMSQVSALVTVLLAIACALFLGGVLSDLPQATLACLVFVAVIGLIKPAELRRFWRLDRLEFWVAVMTAVSGLLLGLLAAVLVGVLLTLFLVLRELNRSTVVEMQPTPDLDDVRYPGADTQPVPGLLIVRFDGPLYGANIRNANRRLLAAVDAARPDTVIVDGATQAQVPVSVIDQFQELDREFERREVVLWLAGFPPRTLATAEHLPGWRHAVEQGRVFPSALAAVQAYANGRD